MTPTPASMKPPSRTLALALPILLALIIPVRPSGFSIGLTPDGTLSWEAPVDGVDRFEVQSSGSLKIGRAHV